MGLPVFVDIYLVAAAHCMTTAY